MEPITSANNPIVKQLRKLMTQPKARRDMGLYIAEGAHLVESYLATGDTPVMLVLAKSAGASPEIEALVHRIDEERDRAIVLADSLFESLFTIHASVGVVIAFEPHTPPDTLQLKTDALLLEDVQDPGNLGTMLRTAAASGVKTAVLSSQCASPWSPKALRAGMGAQFSLTLYEEVDLVEAVRTAEVPVYVTTLSEKSNSLYKADLRQPTAWIFGNEGQGVSEALAEAADAHVTIPQAASSVESLNVAAAVAVCLFEQYRQRI